MLKVMKCNDRKNTAAHLIKACFLALFIVGSGEADARSTVSFNSGWKFTKGNPAAAFEHVLMEEIGTVQGENNWYYGYSTANTGGRTGLMGFDAEWYSYMSAWCYPVNNGACYITDGRHISAGRGPDDFTVKTAFANNNIPRIEWISPYTSATAIELSFTAMFNQDGNRVRVLKNGVPVWESPDMVQYREKPFIVPLSVGQGDIITVMGSVYSSNCQLSLHYLTIADAAADTDAPVVPAFDDAGWEDVMLPYEPVVNQVYADWPAYHYRGVMWYRKSFNLDSGYAGKKLFLEFEAANLVAEVWINGTKLATHYNSFFPFTVDITDYAYTDGTPNNIAVKVDGREDEDIPSWSVFGGITGDVHLHVTDKLHITDAVRAGKEAGGGIFVRYPSVSNTVSEVMVQTHVTNEYPVAQTCTVETRIFDTNQVQVAFMTQEQVIPQGGDFAFVQNTSISNVHLWSPESPYLYTVDTKVLADSTVIDTMSTRIGIRSIFFSKAEGFKLNGQPYRFRGANSNTAYPYIGVAVSDEAIYRDLKRLRELGFNYLRPSPEFRPCDPAYLKACDELGLLLLDPISAATWNNTTLFKERCYQNMRDLIRRDRNHPCVIAWELSLNEQWWDDPDFSPTANAIGHAEYPGDQCYTAAWKDGGKYGEPAEFDIHIATPGAGARTYTGPLPLIVSEHGHWEYVTAGVDVDSDCVRKDGELPMLSQAFNHMQSHNLNLEQPYIVGDGVFTAVDYLAFDSGILDFFRLPKFSAYFWQSQRDPSLLLPGIDSGPMLKIASYWKASSPSDVTVFSNCEEVKLYVNNVLVDTRTPDVNTNATYVAHPPTTFSNVVFSAGELKAEGYIGGQLVSTDIVNTPGAATHLELSIAAEELASDGDVSLVHVSVLDANGTVVPDNNVAVTLQVTGGPAFIIGSNQMIAEAGIAGFLIRTDGNAGTVSLSATASGLTADAATVESVDAASSNNPPAFIIDPINGVYARQGDSYGGTLAGTASDPDAGNVLTYTNAAGPGWLSIAYDGELSGTPGASDVGTNIWSVQVSDGNGGIDLADFKVIVEPVTSNSAAIPADRDQPYPQWLIDNYNDIDTRRAAMPRDLVNVAFVGDSITYGWLTSGLSVWNETFNTPGNLLYSCNLGVSGDRTEHVLYRVLSQAEGGRGDFDDPDFAPKVIVLKIGVNNGQSTEDTAEGIHEVVSKLLIREPQARVLLLSVLPTSYASYDPLNAIISQYPIEPSFAGRVVYYDLNAHYRLSNGDQDAQYFQDGVHLNEDGYVVWRDAIVPVLSGLLTESEDPSFLVDPLLGEDAYAELAYAGSLSGLAVDPNRDPLTYSLVSGPPWLTVAPDGTLGGTPAVTNIGLNTFVVQVADGNGGSDTATLKINVLQNISSLLVVGNEDWPVTWGGAAKSSSASYHSAPSLLSGQVTVSSGWNEAYHWQQPIYYGCVDGTFGSSFGADAITNQYAGSALSASTNTSYIDFTVTTGSEDVHLISFHFDAYRQYSGNTSGYTLEILPGGALTNQVITNNSNAFPVQGGLPTTGTVAVDYFDVDVSLLELMNGTRIPAGQSVTFRLTYDAGQQWYGGLLDNIAVVAGIGGGEPAPFDAWVDLNFTPEQLSDPNISGPVATPSGDGIPNLVKYVLNLDPWVTGGIEPGWPDSNDWVVGFDRNTDAYDVNLYLDMKDSLTTGIWQEIARSIGAAAMTATNGASVLHDIPGQTNGVQVAVPLGTNAFFRFRAEQN